MKNLLLTAVATLGLTAATMAQVPSYVPTNGLVGWWPFNGNANDESGNGNNGTVNGATLTTDRFGNTNKAYSFDGNSFISIGPYSLFSPNELSISCWFNRNVSSDNDAIIGIRGSVGANTYVSAHVCNNNTCLGFYNGTTFNTLNFSLINQEWYNIIYVFNNNLCSIFINGNLIGVINKPLGLALNSPIWIGQPDNTLQYNSERWNGKLDDIGIWNRALSEQEIIELFNECELSVNTQPVSQSININNNAQFTVVTSNPNASYQWQTDLGVGFQNLTGVGQYSGATTNTLTVSNVNMSNNNQPFRCIVSSGTCSDTSDVAVLTVNNNASIDALSQEKIMTVYPNPAQNQLHVKTGIELMNASYSIIDNTGRTVLAGQLTSESTVIELSGLSNGTYFLHVGDQLKESFKVVKNQ